MTALAYWKAKLAIRKAKLAAVKKRLATAEKGVAYQTRQVKIANEKIAIARARQGPDKAVAWAAKQVGRTESPSGSNKGPGISDWQRYWLGYDGYSWCGAFVGYALKEAGVKGLVGKFIVYTPSILADAKAGRNGFLKTVPVEEVQKGDLVLMNWPGGNGVDHVGIARGGYSAATRTVSTIEGNTSSGSSGSQSNGGGVFQRTRNRAEIVGIARPRW